MFAGVNERVVTAQNQGGEVLYKACALLKHTRARTRTHTHTHTPNKQKTKGKNNNNSNENEEAEKKLDTETLQQNCSTKRR